MSRQEMIVALVVVILIVVFTIVGYVRALTAIVTLARHAKEVWP